MLIDTFGRTIDYMRVSVTKECNFLCQYCNPYATSQTSCKDELPLEKMLVFIKIAIDNGVKKIRITGGEPLLRPNLSAFIADIYDYAPHIEITLTTNAFFLSKYAKSLKKAGLSRINISLDSLLPERIKHISKRDALPQILKGIDSAKNCGFDIKLNMVPLKGINDDEILDMLHFAHKNGFGIRFIEFMENIHAKDNLKGLRSADILESIKAHYPVSLEKSDCFGPAKLYSIALESTDFVDSKSLLTHSTSLTRYNGSSHLSNTPLESHSLAHSKKSRFIFGIISPHEDDFCTSCNRIRLTSDGVICPCLYYQDSVVAKDAIMRGDKAQMQSLLESAVFHKPEKNQWESQTSDETCSKRAFYYTGG